MKKNYFLYIVLVSFISVGASNKKLKEAHKLLQSLKQTYSYICNMDVEEEFNPALEDAEELATYKKI